MNNNLSLIRWMAYAAIANALLSFSSFVIYMFMSNVYLFSAMESERFHSPESIPNVLFEILYRNYYWLFVLLENIKFFLCFSQSILMYGFWRWLVFPSKFLPLVSLIAGTISVLFLFMAGFIALTIPSISNPFRDELLERGFIVSYTTWPTAETVTQCSMISISAMGLWHLVINLQALRNKQLSKALAVIGIILGTVNLFVIPFPPVAMLTLLFSLIWMIWLGVFLLQMDNQNTANPPIAISS